MDIAIDPEHKYDGAIMEGGYRAGKTNIMAWAFTTFIETFHKGTNHDFAIGAYTVSNVINVIVPYIEEFCKEYSIDCTVYRSINNPMARIAGCNVYFFGGDNKKSQDRIAGYTLYGLLVDEYTRLDGSFLEMCRSRLSGDPNLTLYGANRMHTRHPNTELLWNNAEAMNLLPIEMTTEENYFISQQAMDRMTAGLDTESAFYKRGFLNEYAVSEGLVYPHRDIIGDPDNPKDYWNYIHWDGRNVIGADYGPSTITAAILLSQQPDYTWVATREYWRDCRGGSSRRIKVEKHAENIINLGYYNEEYIVESIAVDPTAGTLIDAISEEGYDAHGGIAKPQKDGINYVATCLNSGIVKLHYSLVYTLGEIDNYAWAETDRGDDKPFKKDDHLMDSLRYAIMTVRPQEEYYDNK